ncbi:hypothetical protein [Acidaminococcus timonensis]|uniref:hypothetical protein n=1 Tax=Acidaminococcus timonensis TaxID=1871002 RepID=UPI002943E6A4|nr:hypothetical protein [Acidaminococcus timonensis]
MEDLDQIIKSITDGLTGNSQKDIDYLKNCMTLYRDHPLHREITKACSELLYKLLPEESRQHFVDMFSKAFAELESNLQEARKLLSQKEYDKAVALLEPMKEDAENSSLYRSDKETDFRSFAEPMEMCLYNFYFAPGNKKLQQTPFPFHAVYLMLANVELARDNGKKALRYLEKARKWDPASVPVLLVLGQAQLHDCRPEEFHRTTLEALRLSFRPEDLASCYQNEGLYLFLKEDYEGAANAYFLSLNFGEPRPEMDDAMKAIEQKLGRKPEPPTHDQLKAFAEKYQLPLGPNVDVLRIAAGNAQYLHGQGNEQGARYYLDILHPFLSEKDMEALKKQLGY